MEEATLYDIVKHINRTFPYNSDEINLKLKSSVEAYFHKILLYLAKMCMFNHELASTDLQTLSAGVYFISLKTLEQVNRDFCP